MSLGSVPLDGARGWDDDVSSEMLARGLARAVSRELRSTKVTSRVVPFAFGAAGMTTTTTASTTLCVLTHEKLVDSRPIAERLRAETPSAFDIVVGSRVEEFDDAISGAGEARDVALLWWFAPRALAEGVMTAAARAERSERVRWMHSGSAGVEHLLAIPSVKGHSSVMTNARGAFSASLGEWGVFACMYFAKRVDEMRAAQRESRWIRTTVGMIQGKEMLVVGYGDIGQHVARRAKAMGMRVSAVRRTPEKTDPRDEHVERVVGFQSLKEAVAKADYVVVALPATKETDKLIDGDVLNAMKETSVLVNVGRGSTIDEDALVDALSNKKIAGAALDVFAVEPLPSDHPFYKLENCLMSFHCADLTSDYHDLALDCFIQHAKEYVEGKPFTNVVDKELGY